MITRCSFETKVILNHQINTRFMRRNLNVLVVDDEAPARELMCRQIERSCPSLAQHLPPEGLKSLQPGKDIL